MSSPSAADSGKLVDLEKQKAADEKIEHSFWHPSSFIEGCRIVLLGDEEERPWFNIFLIFVPLAIASDVADWPDGVTFALSLVAMLPLAERLGFCTEQLAEHTNDTISGLMNASMGNAPELIIAIFALKEGLLRVVQVSLLGSILSNVLLVLGSSLFLGGIKHSTQNFNNVTSTTSSGMLLLSVAAILFPALLDATDSGIAGGGLLLSRISSIFLLVLYLAFLVFQLKTHAHLYEDQDEDEAAGGTPGGGDEETRGATTAGGENQPLASAASSADEPKEMKGSPADNEAAGAIVDASSSATVDRTFRQHVSPLTSTGHAPAPTHAQKEEESDDAELSLGGSLGWLVGVAALIAYMSEILTGSIEGASSSWGLSEVFISCILIPIAGNAAEHASALIFAWKNRLDISLGICVGSATQISMFVIPVLVIIGWAIGQPLSLDFQPFEVGVLLLSVLICAFVLLDGRSHWMQGALLICSYAIVATAFGLHHSLHE